MALIALAVLVLVAIVWIISGRSRQRSETAVRTLVPVVRQQQARSRVRVVDMDADQQRLEAMAKRYLDSTQATVLIEIGDFWRKGAYPRIQSNPERARDYYQLATQCGDAQVAAIARARLVETDCPIAEVDDMGKRLADIHHDAIVAAAQAAELARQLRVEERMYQIEERQPEVGHDMEPAAAPQPEPPMLFLDDRQNVHDHYMNKITRNNLDRLVQMYGAAPTDGAKRIARECLYADSELSDEQKAAALIAIDAFGDSRQFDLTEEQVLWLVLQHVRRDRDLLHNLFLQLIDCNEDGFMVCTTGKISRVVSVVGDLPEFESPRNIYYIKAELETLAGKIRADVLAEITAEQRAAYESGDDDRITERMTDAYLQAVRAEYCDRLGVDFDILEPHLQANMLGF